MITLFENEDFILKSTGHWYDFVGTIEIKNEKPMTFFFKEELYPIDEDECEFEPNEDETELSDVCYGISKDEADYQAQETMTEYFTQKKEDGWRGFLSDCQSRGWFLALIKHYCPEKLDRIEWA